jgi:dTDP-glucose 4,6-dehydratase
VNWDVSDPLKGSLPDLDYVFHLAGVTGRSELAIEDKKISATNVLGTFNVLEAVRRSNKPKILLASSGSVYDPALNEKNPVEETAPIAKEFDGKPESYQQSKIRAERMLLDAMTIGSIEVVIARLFTFVGPHMAPTANYAIASFLRDCLLDRAIRITGDGASVRSYQYSGDMGKWLIRMLLFAESGSIYNVGSDEAVSMKELAETVCNVCKNTNGIETSFSNLATSTFYVPNTHKARTELGLTNEVGLFQAIQVTYENLKSWSVN